MSGNLCLGGRLLARALSAHLALYLNIVNKHRLESALRLHGVMLLIVWCIRVAVCIYTIKILKIQLVFNYFITILARPRSDIFLHIAHIHSMSSRQQLNTNFTLLINHELADWTQIDNPEVFGGADRRGASRMRSTWAAVGWRRMCKGKAPGGYCERPRDQGARAWTRKRSGAMEKWKKKT